MEKEVKKDKGIKIKLCVIILLLLISIGGLVTYIVVMNNDSKNNIENKENENENKENENKKENEDKKKNKIDPDLSLTPLDVNSDVYKSVEKTYNKLHYYRTDVDFKKDYFWTTDKLLNSEMTYEQKMTILVNGIIDEFGECVSDCQGSEYTISKTDFTKRYYQLFGENIEFTDLEVTPSICPSCAPIASAKFEGSEVKLLRDNLRGLFSEYAIPIIDMVKQNDDEVYVYEKIAFIEYDYNDGEFKNKVYSDLNLKKLVTKYNVGKYEDIFNDENFEPFKDKLDTFKYTFKANGDGTYHFVEVEKMR